MTEADATLTREFVEDASWTVMERQVAEVERSIGELETERVLGVYAAIANADLVVAHPWIKSLIP